MRKSLLMLFLGSLLIISGCSAKEETGNQTSNKNIQKNEETERNLDKVSVANENLNKQKIRPKSTPNKDRSNDIKAPDFKLATISGEEFHLSDYEGKVVMLNFWGIWCPPCRKEIPDLINLQSKYNADGLEIVGITINSGSAVEIQKFVDKKQMNYTILTDFDYNQTHMVQYLYSNAIGQPIYSLPTTLIIDREGYIVKGYLGARSEEVFYNDLKEYL